VVDETMSWPTCVKRSSPFRFPGPVLPEFAALDGTPLSTHTCLSSGVARPA
jgi:hypothetical protein